MKLIVGLGNPGPQYERTRHNVGFLIVDEFLRRWAAGAPRRRFQAEVWEATVAGHSVLLLKPQTFMNHSGQAIGEALRFYKLSPADVLVAHDELDLPFGRVRLKVGGGAAGHNGLKSTVAHLGSAEFERLRFGIGRPPPGGEVVNWVLGGFAQDERDQLPALIDRSADGIEQVLKVGLTAAMNEFNRT